MMCFLRNFVQVLPLGTDTNYDLVVKISFFCLDKMPLLSKILIFDENQFLTKILIFGQNFNF